MIKPRDGMDSVIEVFNPEIFIWRVNGIRFQPESHQDGFDAQFIFKSGDDGDAATTASRNRGFPIGFYVSLFSGSVCR